MQHKANQDVVLWRQYVGASLALAGMIAYNVVTTQQPPVDKKEKSGEADCNATPNITDLELQVSDTVPLTCLSK